MIVSSMLSVVFIWGTIPYIWLYGIHSEWTAEADPPAAQNTCLSAIGAGTPTVLGPAISASLTTLPSQWNAYCSVHHFTTANLYAAYAATDHFSVHGRLDVIFDQQRHAVQRPAWPVRVALFVQRVRYLQSARVGLEHGTERRTPTVRGVDALQIPLRQPPRGQASIGHCGRQLGDSERRDCGQGCRFGRVGAEPSRRCRQHGCCSHKDEVATIHVDASLGGVYPIPTMSPLSAQVPIKVAALRGISSGASHSVRSSHIAAKLLPSSAPSSAALSISSIERK